MVQSNDALSYLPSCSSSHPIVMVVLLLSLALQALGSAPGSFST